MTAFELTARLSPTTSAQIGALQECSDFIACGYNVVDLIDNDPVIYLKLVHRSNGNIIEVKAGRKWYMIFVNGTLKKNIDYTKPLICG